MRGGNNISKEVTNGQILQAITELSKEIRDVKQEVRDVKQEVRDVKQEVMSRTI